VPLKVIIEPAPPIFIGLAVAPEPVPILITPAVVREPVPMLSPPLVCVEARLHAPVGKIGLKNAAFTALVLVDKVKSPFVIVKLPDDNVIFEPISVGPYNFIFVLVPPIPIPTVGREPIDAPICNGMVDTAPIKLAPIVITVVDVGELIVSQLIAYEFIFKALVAVPTHVETGSVLQVGPARGP
jgi:hypothetical protein